MMQNNENLESQIEEIVNKAIGDSVEMSETEKASTLFWLNKEESFIAVQIAPSSRAAIGEYFGLSHSEDGIGKVAAVLRELGADAVVDTAIAEDAVTILETKKLISHKKNGENTPLFSSRCAAFAETAKEKFPSLCVSDLPATASVCGALLKEFYKEQTGKQVYVIAVEPCLAHKNLPNVDLVLTTEELVSVLAETNANLRLEKKEALDTPFGESSGSGYICGISGGIADGIARCLSADKSQAALRKFSYSGLYGSKKVREATLTIDGETWKFAVVCGVAAAEELMSRVAQGEASYDYVEVLACENGCVGGDGQACIIGENETLEYAAKLRAQGLKFIENRRAAKAADMSAAATTLARAWSDLVRNGIAQNESINWRDLMAKTMREFLQENAEWDIPMEESSCAEDECPCVDDECSCEDEECSCGDNECCEEETAEETPVEEALVEEVSVEEASVEEPIAEEIAVAEAEEEIVEEAPVEEVIEEAIEETVEEVSVEEISVEDVIEETIEEVMEETTEEIIEEEREEKQDKMPIDPYHTRLSGRDRRKMKRQKKNHK